LGGRRSSRSYLGQKAARHATNTKVHLAANKTKRKQVQASEQKKLTSNASKCFFNCGNYRQTQAAATKAGKLLLFMIVS